MKRFYQRNKYIIFFILLLWLSFLAGCAVGGVLKKEAAATTSEAVTESAEIETTTTAAKISLGKFKLTGYCICPDCCGGYSDGYTATMTIATPGRTIAVDPDVIPYGTVVEIDGYEYVAEDCGEAVKGNHIDILCASHELAECFGVQYAEVFVVTEAEA